jgi:phospholipid/cholesterol/gamma-HCH transport system substrate-binding protein
MKFLTKEVKIAVAAIVAVVILFFGINFLKGINLLKASNYYYVEFDNAAGLTQSSPVYADGFNIGIVRDIRYNYNHPGHVTVEIEVDDKFKMPKGSHGELVAEMLGTVKMNLILDRKNTEMYRLGDTIPGWINGGALDEAAELIPKIAMLVPKLDSILASVNALLADSALNRTLHNTERLTANLESTTRQLNQLAGSDLPQIAGNLNVTTSNFATISDNLKGVDYAATMSRIDTTLFNLQLATEQLNRTDNTIGLFLHDSSFYNNLNSTGANASLLLEDLREHPNRYVHFSLFGRKEKK